MRARELSMALIVAVVTVTACKDKSPPLPAETPFVIFEKNGPMYGVVTGTNGKRFLIKADTVFQCDDKNHCTLQAAGCPTCSVCDCTLIRCIKWCATPPVIESLQQPIPQPGPGPDPAPQPAPTAPK